MGTELDVGECGVENWGRHVCCWGERELFNRELRNREGKGSFYSLGGVPWQQRTLFREAKSLLQQSSPSIR